MAEAIISTIIGDVVSRTISFLIGLFGNRESTEDKLERISHMLIRIQSVVEEAKGRQIYNHGTLQWLSQLINSQYLGYYLLDSIRCGEQEAEEGNEVFPEPQVFTLSLFNPAKRVRVAGCTMRAFSWRCDVDEIDRVLERLQGMSHDLRDFIMLLQNCQPIHRPLATNIFRDGQMFGRYVEKERIINFLVHEDYGSKGELGVLPIIGDNGVGKTTLIQHTCDDARVRNHFPVIMLYNSFSCAYVVKKNEGSPDDPLKLLKGNSFCDKRFLMVFEDVDMNTNQILKELLRSQRCIPEGSKIIITTNNRRAANIGTVEPIIVKTLSFHEYWFFFKAHAFAGRDIENNPRLVAAGNEIARKLNGSFFGAKIVGGVLRDHSEPKFWFRVLRSNIGGMYPLGNGIGYMSNLVDNLLPCHVDMCKVTIFKDPFPPQTTEFATLKDLCSAAPHSSKLACWADDVRFAKVLLCKSVLPFFSHYYIARCSCNCIVGSPYSCSKLASSFFYFAKHNTDAEEYIHIRTLVPMSARTHILHI